MERHKIIKHLGSTGFVYLAHDTQLERDVAIKRLSSEANTKQTELKQQLLTEAKLLAGLKHPSIVSIYDVIETATGGDIIMEFVEGDTLENVVNKGPLELKSFLYVAAQLLSAIATAHEHGILHCDLKPSNIMLLELDRSRYKTTVLDFGMPLSQDQTSDSKSSTQQIVGSIHFIAPEVIESNTTTEASDIYSIGCLLYYALTGKFPFAGDSPVVIMAAHMRNDFIPIQQLVPALPASLCQWLEAHLHYKQDDRVGSCRKSLDALMLLEGIEGLEALSEICNDNNFEELILDSLSSSKKSNITLSAKQQEEFEKSKKPSPSATPQDMVPMSDRINQVRPQDMWYFSIAGERKGPVPFDKVCELIAEGFIRSNDAIYQHRIGEWTPASEIPEFKVDFEEALAMPPRPERKEKIIARNSQRIKAQRAAAKAAQTHTVKEQEQPFPTEITVLIIFSSLAAACLFFQPILWQACLLVTSLLLILTSLIMTRVRMNQCDARWVIPAILLPVLSDLIFAILKPKHGGQSFLLLVLAALLTFYCSSHRYANDVLSQLTLDRLTDLLPF